MVFWIGWYRTRPRCQRDYSPYNIHTLIIFNQAHESPAHTYIPGPEHLSWLIRSYVFQHNGSFFFFTWKHTFQIEFLSKLGLDYNQITSFLTHYRNKIIITVLAMVVDPFAAL
jgi:hypothetical protein